MASERKPVDPISIRHMGAIEVQFVQMGLMAAFVPPENSILLKWYEIADKLVFTMFRQIESNNHLFIHLFTIFLQLAQVNFNVGMNGSF